MTQTDTKLDLLDRWELLRQLFTQLGGVAPVQSEGQCLRDQEEGGQKGAETYICREPP